MSYARYVTSYFVSCSTHAKQLDDRYFSGLEGKYRFDLHFLLQEENAPAGEHIVRARGAWFGNRSISAEVDLEPGKYEVLPKIVASQDPDAPEVHDVVKKLADRNPQKLRQIGMNYDIANAKGIVELTEEEKKKKEAKEKEAKQKKAKEKEDAEKEKAEFEQWKKEKKEREEKEKSKEKTDDSKTEKPTDTAKETKDAVKDESATAEKPTDTSELKPTSEVSSEDKKGAKLEAKDTKPDSEQGTGEASGKHAISADKPSTTEGPPAVSSVALDEPSFGDGPEGPPSVYGGDAAPQPAANAPPPTDNKQNPWNAVCILGLRVYSKDPDVNIRLVKPKTPEETAVLDADGSTQAGATM